MLKKGTAIYDRSRSFKTEESTRQGWTRAQERFREQSQQGKSSIRSVATSFINRNRNANSTNASFSNQPSTKSAPNSPRVAGGAVPGSPHAMSHQNTMMSLGTTYTTQDRGRDTAQDRMSHLLTGTDRRSATSTTTGQPFLKPITSEQTNVTNKDVVSQANVTPNATIRATNSLVTFDEATVGTASKTTGQQQQQNNSAVSPKNTIEKTGNSFSDENASKVAAVSGGAPMAKTVSENPFGKTVDTRGEIAPISSQRLGGDVVKKKTTQRSTESPRNAGKLKQAPDLLFNSDGNRVGKEEMEDLQKYSGEHGRRSYALASRGLRSQNSFSDDSTGSSSTKEKLKRKTQNLRSQFREKINLLTQEQGLWESRWSPSRNASEVEETWMTLIVFIRRAMGLYVTVLKYQGYMILPLISIVIQM